MRKPRYMSPRCEVMHVETHPLMNGTTEDYVAKENTITDWDEEDDETSGSDASSPLTYNPNKVWADWE